MYNRHSTDSRSNAENRTKGASDVEYPTFDGRLIGCRKSDIRKRALRMSNIRHWTMRPIESKKSDPTNKANRIEFSTFDSTECTRLESTPKETELTTSKPLFLSNAKSKDKVSFFCN